MLNKSITNTLNLIKPLEDTWGNKGDAGSWYLNLDFNFQTNNKVEINTWYIESITKTLYAFNHLARVWKILLNPCEHKKFDKVLLEWQPEESYDEYIKKIEIAINNFPDTICTLEVSADIFVFVRTEESPDKPVRAWIRNFSEFSFCGGSIHGKPFLYLDMEHTLFSPSSFFKERNNVELYLLNSPLLEKALRSWEEQFDTEIEAEGLPGIYEYGFLSDENE